mmetsp:Transcript_5175/g.11552  ORF Transcript_5175/g.11552 Transcript_5175/m.11552 type:complete len:151 (-) Transcript_5175:127-579(-)
MAVWARSVDRWVPPSITTFYHNHNVFCKPSMSMRTTESVSRNLGHVERCLKDGDEDAYFSQYTMAGGALPRAEYAIALRLFFHHTLNSHVAGVNKDDFGGASFDPSGFALYAPGLRTREAAEEALKLSANIDDVEVARIFYSVDSVHCYS